MATIRDRVLAAAVELVGTQGVRSLTHVRVDEHAGLPRGSTSNYFRTRSALLDGVVAWVAEHEMADFDPGFNPRMATADDLVDALCALIETQTGQFRARTVARYALFLEGAHDATLRAPLVDNRHKFERWTRGILEGMGAPDPSSATQALMACSEGLVLHRITVDVNADLRPPLALIVRACLAPGAQA